MREAVLIHGYAVGMTSLLRRPAGPNAGFEAFADAIASNRVAVFHWGLKEHLSLGQFFNPFFIFNYYCRERRLAQADETTERLKHFLEETTPRVIVCHSMGAAVLTNYVKHHGLPASVERIVFVQADLDALEAGVIEIPLLNLFCPWDPTLLLSSILHRRLRAGLVGLRRSGDRLRPLYRPLNLHTSSIRDPQLRNDIFVK